MPPRASSIRRDAAAEQPRYDYDGRRLRLVSSNPAPVEAEPSPLVEAIVKYLESQR